jgi:hypothetical protein
MYASSINLLVVTRSFNHYLTYNGNRDLLSFDFLFNRLLFSSPFLSVLLFCLEPLFVPPFCFLSFSHILFITLKEETSVVKQNTMVNTLGISNNTIVNRAVTAATANIKRRSTQSERGSKQYPVSIFYSMATEQDIDIEDELAKGTKSRG